MEINYPQVLFEWYPNDTICHVRTKEEAEHMKEVIMQRFQECKLTLNDEKTKIVHCEDSNRREGGDGCENSFDFSTMSSDREQQGTVRRGKSLRLSPHL